MGKSFLSKALQVGSIVAQFIPVLREASWIIRAGVAIGLNVGAALLSPKAKQQARQASLQTLQLGEVPRQVVIGRAAMAGHLAPQA